MSLSFKRIHFILFGIALLLLAPLVAMQFSSEVSWSAADFGIAALLLVSVGLFLEFLLRNVNQALWRWLAVSLLLLIFLLSWAELAVGIFGTPLAGS